MDIRSLPEERRQQLLEILRLNGKLSVPQASEQLQVSVDTIRRDLKELDHAGLLTRVHGGALPVSQTVPSYGDRKNMQNDAKTRIALKTVSFFQPGQTILIDSGTTAQMVAKHIAPDLNATVITNSPPVAMALSSHNNIQVVLSGGHLNTSSMALTGSSTYQFFSGIHADVCIPGICSLHADAGITTADSAEADVKRIMIEQSKITIAPVTSDKMNAISSFHVTSLDHIDYIITDQETDDDVMHHFSTMHIAVTKA